MALSSRWHWYCLKQFMEAFPHLYSEHDKVMYLKTGHVFTVHADLSNHLDPGIIVKEKVGRLLRRGEVRPAGKTRERFEASRGIEPPDAPPERPRSILQM
jgi:hypothetical protein